MNRPGREVARATDLVVVVNGFPRLSETFVLQELLELERLGLRLRIVALSRPDEAVAQEQLAELNAPVEYVRVPTNRLVVRAAHATLLLSRGRRYLEALVDLLATPQEKELSPRSLRMDQAALLAVRLLRMGSPPVYIHFAHKPATLGRFAARLAGVPYALSCHAKDIWLTPPRELTAKLHDAEIALTCTEEGRAELARLAGGATPVRLVRHGIDVDAVAPQELVEGPPRIVSVGRLVEKKGHDVLVQAAGLLRDRGARFIVRIVGDGVEWPRLQRLVHELELAQHVIFTGPLTPREVRGEYAAASAFCAPCRVLSSGDRDGLPNVVMEAMAHGLPIVATRLAGISEAVVDGDSGILVEPEQPRPLADALARVLEDRQLAQRLGAASRVRVREQFDRRRLLPGVSAALAEVGLIRAPAPLAAPTPIATVRAA